jgi:hypothetical protein
MIRIQQELCSASATDSPSSNVGGGSAAHHLHSPVIGALLAVARPAQNQPRNRHLLAVMFIVLCFTCLFSYYVMLVVSNRQGSGNTTHMSYI